MKTDLLIFPLGVSLVQGTQGGRPVKMWIRIDKKTVTELNKSLSENIKRYPNRPPWIASDISETKIAGKPIEFFWKEGEGIYLTAELETKDHEFICGSFKTDCNFEQFKNVPCGNTLKFKPSEKGGRKNPCRIKGLPICFAYFSDSPSFKKIKNVGIPTLSQKT